MGKLTHIIISNKIYLIFLMSIIFISCNNSIKEYYTDGSIKEVYYKENDTFIGEYISYYSNGQVENKGRYNNEGEMDGIWQGYFENGNVKYYSNLKNGKYKEYKEYNNKGIIVMYSLFSGDSLQFGVEGNYNDKGICIQIQELLNEERNGRYERFDSNGKSKYKIFYNNGEPIYALRRDSLGNWTERGKRPKGVVFWSETAPDTAR